MELQRNHIMANKNLIPFLVGYAFKRLCVNRLPPCNPSTFDSRAVATDLDAVLNRFVDGQDGQRHAIALVDAPTVDFHYTGAVGLGRVDNGEAITPEHQFFVASVGKSMTATVIHQMAEEGAFGPLGIDAALASLGVLPPEVIDQLLLVDGISYGDQITLRHLLNHTSGLRDVFFDSNDSKIALMPGTPDGAATDSLIGQAAFDEQLGLTPLVQCTLYNKPLAATQTITCSATTGYPGITRPGKQIRRTITLA